MPTYGIRLQLQRNTLGHRITVCPGLKPLIDMLGFHDLAMFIVRLKDAFFDQLVFVVVGLT